MVRIIETPFVFEHPEDDSLGATVRRLRSEKGWTQRDLAAQAKLSRTVISGIERNTQNARVKTIIQVLHTLDPALHLAIKRDEHAG